MNTPKLKISMIAAMAHHRVIGSEKGGIPWHLPRDSQHFRDYTAGKFMLLGRTTFEEMVGWFTTQTPIVLTRNADYKIASGFVADSMETAIALAADNGAKELVISGGASIYTLALPFADELVLTFIQTEIEGTRHFPDYKAEAEWETILEKTTEADAENQFAMQFVTLQRRSTGTPVRDF